jgi:pimeloyl-ACP methyl ester carboxylesterase
MRSLAEAGHLAVVVPAPFGLAVLAPDSADAVIAAHPEVQHWVIGGHSLGGAMAAQYAHGHGEVIDGLVLWAAYPTEDTDLSDADIASASILATEDGLATAEEVTGAASRLPPGTAFVTVEGGNHAGFGWYGEQGGDGTATISREAQQEQVTEATLAVLDAVSAG